LISSSIVASTGAAFAKSLADFKAAKHKDAEQIFGLFQLSKPDAVVESSTPLRGPTSGVRAAPLLGFIPKLLEIADR